MRAIVAGAQAVREERGALLEIPMVYLEARDRDSGNIHGIGLWSGPAVENIWVTNMWTGSALRIPFYNQAVLEVGSIRYEVGLGVQVVTIALSSINVAVEVAFREYDPRGARVQIWNRCYNPDTRKPIGVEPRFKGFIDTAPIDRPVPGGEGRIEAQVVSTARGLTIASALKKSHQAQLRRSGDKFRQYKVSVPHKDVPWGTEANDD